MKKSIVLGVALFMSGCAAPIHKNEPEQREQYITTKKPGYVVDLCAQENMPRFKYAPRRPTKAEIARMSEDELDARLRVYIDSLEDHIKHLENVIVETRLRVERCK